MFLKMIVKSITRNLRRKLMAVITIAFGASLVAAMFNLWLDVGDKMGRELKTYGSNITVKPKAQSLPFDIGLVDYDPLKDAAFIDEADLPKIKTIFWHNNIIGFAPNLEARAAVGGKKIPVVGTWFNKKLIIPTGETIRTGVKVIKPWWEIDGAWIDESQSSSKRQLILGKELAKKLNARKDDNLDISFDNGKTRQYQVSGILDAGGGEEDKAYVKLADLQQDISMTGKVAWVDVSAVTTPENELARRYEKDPDSLSSGETEKWYCTAYVSAIAFQLEESIKGVEAKAVRQVSESESLILNKIQLLILLLTVIALVSSYLGIWSLMGASVLERSKELGLAKALGATDNALVRFFLAEAAIVGVIGGIAGYGLGILFVQAIGNQIFGRSVEIKIGVMPVAILASVIIAVLGNLSSVKAIIRLNPKDVLYGR